jgi:hypothetical protein
MMGLTNAFDIVGRVVVVEAAQDLGEARLRSSSPELLIRRKLRRVAQWALGVSEAYSLFG